MTTRARDWLRRWGPILPLLIAEGTIWVGFGALLPILPIWFTKHGVDLPTLGIVLAAWPASRLVFEPVFGWVADRTRRKPMMVLGLVLSSVFTVLPVLIVGPLAFLGLRALTGLCASIYDPAARGYIVDVSPPERQGETFGLYGAAQMGGLMIGPAIGGMAAAISGSPEVVFWVGGAAILVSALLVAARVPDLPNRHAVDAPVAAAETDPAGEADGPKRLLNVLIVAALVFNFGGAFSGGAYEVIWTLYMTSLGAGLDLIGISFVSFALPILVLSPFLGRRIDRRGGYVPLVAGMAGVIVSSFLYPAIASPWWLVWLGLIEGSALALSAPALFLLVARASPRGRASTAQGLFGAAGTLGTIVASLSAGVLAAADLRFPFYAVAAAETACLVLGLAIGGSSLRRALRPHDAATEEGAAQLGEAGAAEA